MRLLRTILVCSLTAASLLALPSGASAMLIGLESNGEFINSDRVPALQNPALDKAKSLGAQVIRVNVGWNEIAGACAGRSLVTLANHENDCYHWAILDNLVRESHARGIQLLVSVSRAPVWVNNSADPMFVGATGPQFTRFVDNYAAFMRAIGTRYGTGTKIGKINLWTIWNEPNSTQFWRPLTTRAQKASAPLRYAVLYSRSAVALRSANPQAAIAPGPTGPAPSNAIPPATFILTFQKHVLRLLPGASVAAKRRYLNAWAHNPYPYARSARLTRSKFVKLNYPNLPLQRTRDLVRVLDRSPITRKRPIWATEFGYESYPQERIMGVPLALQGRYMAEALDVLDATGRVTVAIWYGMTDPTAPADWQSGSFFANGAIKPAAYWQRRPISVAATRVRRGMRVQVWAKSQMKPKAARIQYSYNGRTWRTMLGTRRRADGSIRANVRVMRPMYLATFDGVRGPAVRVVTAR